MTKEEEKEQKKEKEIKKYPLIEDDEKPMVVKEPMAIYGLQDFNFEEAKRYTYADYLTWWDDKRRELINGFIHLMSPAATFRHAQLITRIGYKILSYIDKRKGKCQVCYAPFDVRLPKRGETADDKIYTVVQPDICVICDQSKIDIKGCIGAPELVVEVQSPATAKYDLTEKFMVYETAGVPEYWVVSPETKTIKVFLLQENGLYNNGTNYHLKGKMPVQTLEGMKLDIGKLFEDLI